MKSTAIQGYEERYVYCVLIRGYAYDKLSILDNVNHYYQHFISARRLRTILEKLMKLGLVEKEKEKVNGKTIQKFKKGKDIPIELDMLLEEPRVVFDYQVPTPVKERLWQRILNRLDLCRK